MLERVLRTLYLDGLDGRSNGRSITEMKFQMHVTVITALNMLLQKCNSCFICLLRRGLSWHLRDLARAGKNLENSH